GTRRSRDAVRGLLREVGVERERRPRVERGRQQRLLQRAEARDAEGREQQRQRDDQESAPVELPVDGALERAATPAPASPGRRLRNRHLAGYSKNLARCRPV